MDEKYYFSSLSELRRFLRAGVNSGPFNFQAKRFAQLHIRAAFANLGTSGLALTFSL
jgi:hypothetical protein